MGFELQLTKGKVASIDESQLQRCNDYNWYYNPRNGYAYTKFQGSCIYLHHFVWGATRELDHKDRNKLNCQLNNLRPATRSQNCGNSVGYGKRCKYKGVIPANGGRFKAKLCSKHLGTFDTQEQAAKAYTDAAKQHYGEFAHGF